MLATRASYGLPDDAFVFCAFNNAFKITPDIFALWMRLLQQVGNSVLWIYAPDADTQANLAREALAHGVEPGKLVFAGHEEQSKDIQRYALADLFVDTLYYNAHTTCSDALWAGLPVVTCAGQTFASRVAGSILYAAGLPELVTTSLDEYEALVLKLARDKALLTGIRRKLAGSIATSALFDSKAFCGNLEEAYGRMVKMHLEGQAPQHFDL